MLDTASKRQNSTKLLAHPSDRKSTRLNSSHVRISYAVFCWKKKIGGQDAHEAGQYDHVRVPSPQLGHQGAINLFAGTILLMVHNEGFDVCLGCPLQRAGTGAVAANGEDFAGEIPFTAGVYQGLKVGAAARSQNNNGR